MVKTAIKEFYQAFLFTSLYCCLDACESQAMRVSNREAFAGLSPAVVELIGSHNDDPNWSKSQQDRSLQSCSSEGRDWIRVQSADVPPNVIANFERYGIGRLPSFHKALFDQNEENEYLGYDGLYTEELFARYEAMEQFWVSPGIASTQSLLLGAHGRILANRTKLVQICEVFYDLNSGFTYDDIADEIEDIIEEFPGTYDHPRLTYRASAFSAVGIHHSFRMNVTDTVVMGDGLIQGVRSLGFSDDGPDIILAHEFAHILQFKFGLSLLQNAEQTRYRELMADAVAAYFMAHPAGGKHLVEEVDELYGTAALFGDYTDWDVSHHGTPEQRECATLWAATVGVESKTNVKMTFLEFKNEFDRMYEAILEMDSAICPDVVEQPDCLVPEPPSSPTGTPIPFPTRTPFSKPSVTAGTFCSSDAAWLEGGQSFDFRNESVTSSASACIQTCTSLEQQNAIGAVMYFPLCDGSAVCSCFPSFPIVGSTTDVDGCWVGTYYAFGSTCPPMLMPHSTLPAPTPVPIETSSDEPTLGGSSSSTITKWFFLLFSVVLCWVVSAVP